MFRQVYESALYQPVFFWMAGLGLLIAVTRRLAFLYAYLVAFVIEILADVTLNGALSPVPPNGRLAGVLGALFIVLGDARYFVLVARAMQASGALTPRSWIRAFAIAVVVPAASYAATFAFPSTFANARVLYLAYEIAFLVLALAVRAWLARRAWPGDDDGRDRRSALLATSFEIAQYGLWAMADVVILMGHDVGYALRLVPNAMYYALFLPFAWLIAPERMRAPSGSRDPEGPWREARA
jgi:hypothetical protein